jgi:N-acyl homoserine lactone hydrolase
MTRMTANRMWALEPATYQSPAQVDLLGDAAPRIPFPVYLVEHDDGLALFDAGLDPDHVGDPAGAYGEVAVRIRMAFREGHLIEHQLARLGFSLADVGTVIASHLHFDHAGALKQFPHARTFLGAGEMAYARAPERFSSTWFRVEDFDDRHGIQWSELADDHDVFGDGAVTVLHLPGHTPGSLGALVRLPGATYILTGDVVHTRTAYDSEVHYHGDVDSLTARASLRKLARLEQAYGGRVWICHDPDDWERYGGAGEKR